MSVAPSSRATAFFLTTLACAALFAAVAGCKDRALPLSTPAASRSSDASVLGGAGRGSQTTAAVALTDAQGKPFPRPPLPAQVTAQAVRSGDSTALAVWVQDGHATASVYAPGTGWGPARPLEAIYGEASEAQLASSGRGQAMAVWQHTVGKIQSLRFSRYEAATGWSAPDVMPGALPREPHRAAVEPPQLSMDTKGNAFARWPSGFDLNQMQSARFVPGQGWSRAQAEPLASAGLPASAAQP